ncbi:hypothetical protein [Streptomyces griseus]|nr:hypothetical protein [Streptomyces griseus]
MVGIVERLVKNRPTCGYYLRSVVDGIPDRDLYNGTPVTNCG